MGQNLTMLTKKRFARVFMDSVAWIVAAWLSTLLRFEGQLPQGMGIEIWRFASLAIAISLASGICFSIYVGKFRNASIEEFLQISLATAVSTLVLFSVRVIFTQPGVPRSIPIVSGFVALIFMMVFRVLANPRNVLSFKKRQNGEPTLIYGAGIVGRQIVEQMLLQSDQYNPIGFLDDDPSISNLRIFGRPIFGNINQLEKVARTQSPTILILAISDMESKSLLDLERRCRTLGLTLRIIPTAHQIVSGAFRLTDIEDLSEEDLLGRRPIVTNEEEISNFIRGKRVLITGAGGSIGSEIARQVHGFAPMSLTLMDRDETALLNLQLSIDGTGLLTDEGLILGDVRDRERLEEIFATTKPEIVFHAAALKHLTTLERFPEEAHKTNVMGTKNVLEMAIKFEVKTFVNISTDKAADPSSALGKSKLATERLTSAIVGEGKKYISVRFGNVIGSNGSFIHTFRYQIRHGGPVTITHPDVTRFFMTVSEAVHLVLQSVLIGRNGETLILDMGQPVSIDAIAKHMIEVSGRKIDIKYTGLRDGEKLHEVLISPGENIETREHPFIMHTRVIPTEDLETK
jgi:FlaA1/EpsC-like NDP-sugar epimerase